MVEFRTRAPGGEERDGGGSDVVDQAISRVMDGLKENPRAQAQVAQALQENYGVPPGLLVSAFPDLQGHEGETPEGPEGPSPEGDAPEPVDVPAVDTPAVDAATVKGFLSEVAEVHPKGWDATLGDLDDIDDDLVETALSMSDLPT